MNVYIVPCNPKKYLVASAFSKLDKVDWKQRLVSIKVGDIVLIYLSQNIKAIKYICRVEAVNKPNITIDDAKFRVDPSGYTNFPRHMELKLLGIVEDNSLSFDILRKNGLTSNLMGACCISGELEKFLLVTIKKILDKNI